jgi:acyl-CoA dehydrogenase
MTAVDPRVDASRRPVPAAADVPAIAARVGADAAAPAADSVDRDARFPIEAVDAMRAERLLGAFVPARLGGAGASIVEIASAVEALAQHCATTGMVYAMHQIQVHCIIRHGRTPALETYLSRVASDDLLLASATTEAKVGGDTRTSLCAVERSGDRFTLEKQASVISYGNDADAVLATARATPDSASNDQVLVLCRPPGLSLEQTGGWDTLGFRGTCSLGFLLRAEGPVDEVLADPFADISAQTMLPTSHILWSSVWLGIANAAVQRARHFIRAEARKTPGSPPPGSVRLAEVVTVLQQFAALVHGTAVLYDSVKDDADHLGSLGFALAMNSLKVSSSTLVVDIVGRAMGVCGIAAYREDSPYSMGRLLRDAHGAPLMINNDRILGHNAQMLLVHKGD